MYTKTEFKVLVLGVLWCVIHDKAFTFAKKNEIHCEKGKYFSICLNVYKRGVDVYLHSIVCRVKHPLGKQRQAKRMMRNNSSISLHHLNGLPKHRNKVSNDIGVDGKRG